MALPSLGVKIRQVSDIDPANEERKEEDEPFI